MPGLITFLSDFGRQDTYVGVIKGVIAQINPQLRVIDLVHEIPAQNLAQGSFHLGTAYPHFPVGTVHLAVVDPGVGSDRRGIAIQTETGFLVGPDNGLFSSVLDQLPDQGMANIRAVELTQTRYWYTPSPSSSFHGRDIFAPVAAHLASGVALADLGSEIAPQSLVRLPIPSYHTTPTGVIGTIQSSDRFGNLITNIPAHCLLGQSWQIKIGLWQLPLLKTYSDGPVGAMIGLIGSHGWLEIAVNGGNAEQVLGQHPGNPVEVISLCP
jgi:S-adenosyl-L-methionine hydrolase (adenosine-forming)